MLVKYKNLDNNKLTEEKDLFIHQIHQRFPDIDEDFINAAVTCIQNAIFKENEIRIVKEGCRTQENVKSTVIHFLSEIKKFSQDPNYYHPEILSDSDGFWEENLKFLLRANPEDLAEFSEAYNTTIPNVSREHIGDVVKFIFNTMKDATERGLDGEKCQTQKARTAEETWNSEYPGNENTASRTNLSTVTSTLFERKNLVTFKPASTHGK